MQRETDVSFTLLSLALLDQAPTSASVVMNTINVLAVFASAVLMGSCPRGIVALRSHRAFITANQNKVPDGGKIEVTCTTSGKIAGLKHRLFFKAGGSDWDPVVTGNSRPCVTERGAAIARRRPAVVTAFTMSATRESTGLYRCQLFWDDGTAAMGNDKDEVAVRVCRSPRLSLSHQHEDGTITVTSNEECGYMGETTWLVNDAPVPREPAGVRDVRETDDDALVISRQSESAAADVCQATAVFTYMHLGPAGQVRRHRVTETLQISECRIRSEDKTTTPLTMKKLQCAMVHDDEIIDEEAIIHAVEIDVLIEAKRALQLLTKYLKNKQKTQGQPSTPEGITSTSQTL